MNIHESAEDYLEVILVLQQRLGQVRSIDIVNEFQYSKPSVSIAMKKLKEKGYVATDREGHLLLTEKGQQVATRVYERHQVIAKFLMQLGVEEEVAYADACKMEHDLSEQSYSCMKSHLKGAESKK